MTQQIIFKDTITRSDLAAVGARRLIGQYDHEIRSAFLATRSQWHEAVAAIYVVCTTLKLPDARRRWLESHNATAERGKNPFAPVVKLLLNGASDPIRRQA